MDNKLQEKLADLRSSIGGIKKNSTNPFYKSEYFDINELLDQLQPELEERNLLLIQPIKGNSVYTIIQDTETGDSVESWLELPEQQDPQKMGSAITYFRRYTAQSLLGLRAVDDDGNKASGKTTRKSKPKSQKKSRPEPDITEVEDSKPKGKVKQKDIDYAEKINEFDNSDELVAWFNSELDAHTGESKNEFKDEYLPLVRERVTELH